jgi:hypothetical protein
MAWPISQTAAVKKTDFVTLTMPLFVSFGKSEAENLIPASHSTAFQEIFFSISNSDRFNSRTARY